MKNIYFYLFLLAILCSPKEGIAQQIPTFNNDMYAPQFFNAARLGEGFIGLNYRQQWSGLDGDVAPKSFFLATDLSSLLKLNDKRIGLGFTVMTDEAHVISRNQLKLGFAYHLIDDQDKRLSAGISLGWLAQKLTFGDSRVNDPFDLAFFDGEQNKGGFEGGFGLSFQLFPSEEHQLNFDIALPQLYASDLTFDSGAKLELNPHLISRISYQYNGGSFGLEPILIYRESLGGKKLKAANLEFGVRALFLDNKFWVGTGTRMETETIQLNAGVNLNGVQVFGSYEMGSPLGNTVEIGGLYTFGGESSRPTFSEEALRVSKTNEQLAKEFNQSAVNVSDYFNLIQSNLNDVNKPGLTSRAKRDRVQKASNYLTTANNTLKTLDQLRKEIAKNQDLIEKEVSEKGGNKNVKWVKTARQTHQGIQLKYNELNTKEQKFQQQIKTLESRTLVDIGKIIRSGNTAELRSHYQQQLDDLKGKPRNMLPVDITLDNQNITISYKFPNGKEVYDATSADQADVQVIANHIIEKVEELTTQNYRVESIDIIAEMRVSADKLIFTSGTYNGELGNPAPLAYKFFDKTARNITPKTKQLKVGSITLEDLAALKIHSLKAYLASENVNVNKIELQIAAPNQQRVQQMYMVRLNVKR